LDATPGMLLHAAAIAATARSNVGARFVRSLRHTVRFFIL
jgi:hypothetical protein